ncbi:phospholipase A2 inhibitor and Ly6/PLAUR domain-containing protein-like [Discoglossus pictus]
MASFLILICTLSALTATGYSLSCIHCIGPTGTFCTGQSLQCVSEDYACATVHAVTLMGGVEVTNTIARQCVPRKGCDKAGSISIPQGRVKSSTTCCYRENCEPPTPSFPQDRTGKNGVVCKSCMSTESNSCPNTMECVGNENKCILQTTVISGEKSAKSFVRGCAAPSMCEVSKQETEILHQKIYVETTCTDGSASLHHNLALMFFASIFICKLIF